MKTFQCISWKDGFRCVMHVEAPNGYEAQKQAARYFKVKMIKVQVIECGVTFEALETFPA